MTDSEIVKALECCGDEEGLNWCVDCPYYDKENDLCEEDLHRDALNLINRLEARIGVYETCNARKDEAIKHLEAEIVNANCNYDNMRLMYIDKKVDVDRLLISNAEIKAEAYKEFAELLCKIWQRYEDENISGIYIPKWVMRVYEELTDKYNQPNDVKCIDCEHLELSLPYGVCSKEYKMVDPNDSCGKGKLKETVGDNNA